MLTLLLQDKQKLIFIVPGLASIHAPIVITGVLVIAFCMKETRTGLLVSLGQHCLRSSAKLAHAFPKSYVLGIILGMFYSLYYIGGQIDDHNGPLLL